ncbi:MAG: C69 family dipeptidase [Candidatus Helarchaeota archaeon]|nr:C69 family dipeptidase [Candidatus Helarchaeota archaeon]
MVLSCDTFVAVGSATVDKSTIFGKNSDRPYREVQNLIHVPHLEHSEDMLKCTYIEIPQVPETLEVLLCQPYWMWGAEMGANEFGVVIGNEAVYSKEPDGPPALLGMDLLRLGLERGKSAKAALDVIAGLLEEFGQGGGCSADDPSWSYHNSFLIADAKEAWVFETAGKWWIAEKIVDDIRNISNDLSIRTKYDLTAEGLVDYAVEKGYWRSSRPFDFAKAFSWGNVSDEPSPFSREGRGRYLLRTNKGSITPELMLKILRDHDDGICMHGGFRSTASMVSRIDSKRELTVHWFTGTPNPCRSFFKPIFMSSNIEIPKQFTATLDPNPQTLWWAHELVLQKKSKQATGALSNLEKKFLKLMKELINFPEREAQRKSLSLDAFNEEWAFYQKELQ